MARAATLHVRVDAETKTKGDAALAAIGLSVTDAVRLLYNRSVADQAFSLALKVPNAVTRDAMADADAILAGRRAQFDGSGASVR